MRARTRSAAVAAVGLLGLALAGCGAGQDASTATQLPSVPGVDVAAADQSVMIRNAYVEFSEAGYPTGGTAPVRMWLVNNTYDPVRLVEVTSEQASSVDSATPVVIPSSGLVEVTLQADGLQRQIGGATPETAATTALPLVLRFDNGVELAAAVTMVPPLEAQPREPMDLSDH